MVEENKGKYHHGLIIREHRKLMGMTQAQLADVWPKSERFGGGEGVNWRYVQDIEHGRKRIEDNQTLRKLCDILQIPYWKVGLSEYDPFTAQTLPGHGKSMYTETLDVVESLVRQIWSLRCAARIPEAERGVARLSELFTYFHRELPPPLQLERRFQFLYVQYLRLKATAYLEKKQYAATMATYEEIFNLVKNADEPAVKALALKSIGKELERKGDKQEAVDYLEEARDVSMDASKLLRAFIHSYLIRVYASNGDLLRFERAVHTGLTIARSLPGTYEDGTDFVYSWSPVSAILAEQSWGYISLGQPEKILAMRDEITKEIQIGQDARVDAWIPLDWAKAYKMIGEIEKCIDEAREFYRRCTIMQSPHAISQVNKLLATLDKDGYADVQAVKDFREEIEEKRAK
ncbi:MAG: helix-turn-helix transcriptional regulator [Chloroflexi bacterium]|nr:helix-turn-helix transcriptional regulator [Chloroflexota bacterium]